MTMLNMDVSRYVSWSRPQARIACPECQPHRRHKGDKTLSITLKPDGLATYYCHHCGIAGGEKAKPAMTNSRDLELRPIPAPVRVDQGHQDHWHWLAGRSISKGTAEAAGVRHMRRWIREAGGETDCIGFPYVVDGRVVATKYRALTLKGFTMEGRADHFFGLNLIPKDATEAIITEGEIDALSFLEAGLPAISVPSGAMSPGQNAGSKLACIANALSHLKPLKKIYIATDNDPPGQALGEEIARRLGRARCWKVAFPDGRKDANEVVKLDGLESLRRYVSEAQPWPVKGLYDVAHYTAQVFDEYANGSAGGDKIGLPSVDELMSFVPGELSVITGIPGSGKSEFVDQIMVSLAERHDWRFAVCSFENPPRFHIPKLLEKHIGKPFRMAASDIPRLEKREAQEGLDWLQERFFFLESADGDPATIESILTMAEAAVVRHGVKGLVIDPYNYLAMGGDSETNAISAMLTKVRDFARAYSVHVFFVAHPTKLYRENGQVPVPKGYDISGCYSADTEALTKKGWVLHRDITVRDVVACFRDGAIEWHHPEMVHEYPYDGEMHHWKSRDVDLLVTPNHHMLLSPGYSNRPKNDLDGKTNHQRWNAGWNRIKSMDVPCVQWKIPMGGDFPASEGSEVPSSLDGGYAPLAFWRYVGFWIAEGSNSCGTPIVCQAAEGSRWIKWVIAELGLTVTERSRKDPRGYKDYWTARPLKRAHPEFSEWIFRECGVGSANKKLPLAIWGASLAEKKALWEGLAEGDGCRAWNRTRYSSTSSQLANDVQRLALEIGCSATLRSLHPGAKAHYAKQYGVSVSEERYRLIAPYSHMEPTPYTGKVYCLTVPTGAYIVRRNGRATVCGNSAAWFSKADLGITIHRTSGGVEVWNWKTRFKHIGKTGVGYLAYDPVTGRYNERLNLSPQDPY